MPKDLGAAVRRFYQAFAERDFSAVRECFAENALWHLPGKSRIAGDYRGADAIIGDFLAKLGPLSGGTFNVELLDIGVGDRYVVAIQRATGMRDGKTLDVTACQLITVEDGKIAEIRGHYSDQYALDDFWS